jgi:hypothetical protein
LVKNGFVAYTSPRIDISNPEEIKKVLTQNKKSTMRRIGSLTKNTIIAFFSFAIHRVFLNIPKLPRYIKSSVSRLFSLCIFIDCINSEGFFA